jgi:beta-lactamase superfamily II metal-dependent hydrolase
MYDLGSGEVGSTTLSILFPDHDPTNLESNVSSIVARLSYGESSYLLTGDSPIEIEEYLVEQMGGALMSDVLKVGHHGSRTSTSENFITAVSPTYGIISAGKDNSYGHPHKEVVDRLTEHNVIQKKYRRRGQYHFRDRWGDNLVSVKFCKNFIQHYISRVHIKRGK